ncbi:hypothetical protein ACVWZV_002962 [Bradyrhizobium sp. GM5.1]
MYVGRILSTLGGQGPMLLVISLCAGLVITPFAHLGYDLLPFSAFLLTLGSFLTAGLAPSEASIRPLLMGVVLAWVGLVLPFAAAILLSFAPLDPALRAGVLLSLLAPPVGSAAAIAGMLGLRPRLALLVSIALTLLTPISIPSFATVLGLGIAFDMGRLAIRLFSIIGAAGLVAFLAMRFRRHVIPVLPDQKRRHRDRRCRAHDRGACHLARHTGAMDQQRPAFRRDARRGDRVQFRSVRPRCHDVRETGVANRRYHRSRERKPQRHARVGSGELRSAVAGGRLCRCVRHPGPRASPHHQALS